MKPVYKLLIAIAVPLTVGLMSGYFTSAAVNGWYATVEKPSFNPPNSIFAPVWTTLYILMGIAFFLIWKSNVASDKKRPAIIFYFIQLLFNFLWSFLFFKMQSPAWALADIILLWVSILTTMISFRKISRPAAWLMLPYICWVSFAVAINYSIWNLN